MMGEVPFYHAPAATEAIRRKLGPYLTEARLNGKLLRNLIEKWQVSAYLSFLPHCRTLVHSVASIQVYDEDKKTYISFNQACKEIDYPSGADS